VRLRGYRGFEMQKDESKNPSSTTYREALNLTAGYRGLCRGELYRYLESAGERATETCLLLTKDG
jgi:hypothetical protein